MKKKIKLTDYVLNWKLNSLFVKTLGQLCLLVLVPLCGIIGLSYYTYNNMREDELQKQCKDASNNIAVTWNQIQEECDQEFSFLSFDSEVELFIFDMDIQSRYYNLEHVIKLLKLPVLASNHVSNVCIYNYSNNYVLDKNGKSKLSEYAYRDVVEKVIDQKNRGIVVSDPGVGLSDQYVALYWKYEEGKKNVMFIMHLSVRGLLENINFQEYGNFYIIDQETILLSNETAMIGVPVEKLKHDKERIGEDYYVDTRSLDRYQVEIITCLEKSQMKSGLGIIGKFMVYFIVIMFFITLGMAVWISSKLYRPFGEIVRLIRENDTIPESGEGFESKNELEYILMSIEKRHYFNDDVSVEMGRRLALLKKAQAIALQSQINPHFINNTLENINYMAISALGQKNEVSQMVKALADMLHSSLSNTEVLIPISEEIAHCEKYLKIQSIRYQDTFDVTWEIEPEVYGCKIIRIVLQPIIENSIYHGIKHLSVKGHIKVVARCIKDNVQIEIIDNGMGMTEEKKEELHHRMNQDMIQESNHIGLTNVYQRLKLYYGEECEVRVESKLGVGTTIILWIPKQMD